MSIDGLPIEHQYQNRASLQKILRFIYKKHDTGTEWAILPYPGIQPRIKLKTIL